MNTTATKPTALTIITRWKKITEDYEYGAQVMLDHKRRPQYGNSREADTLREAQAQAKLMRRIIDELREAGYEV